MITKCLVIHLKSILPCIVAPTQSSFVPRRQIIDNVVVVQEVLHSMRRKRCRDRWMVLKIDLEKAYDRVDWDGLRDTLTLAGFPSSWVEVVMDCVSSASMKLLWNGEATDEFRPTRGIRQGDPLSPYLFVLVMERLSHLICEAVEEGDWKPVRLKRNGTMISHLFFADDLVLFAKAEQGQIDVIKRVLDCFCLISGQKVSFAKSSLMVSSCVSDEEGRDLARQMGMRYTREMGRYLGIPMVSGRVVRDTFHHVVSRVRSRLEGWQAKQLSFAGRATLVRAVTSAIPTYTMQTCLLPRGTCDEIDRINNNFLWSGKTESRSMHLVAWKNVCQPKEEGGLGLRRMRDVNMALVSKLGWRFLHDEGALWVRILSEKYGTSPLALNPLIHRPGESHVWRGIVSAAGVIYQGRRFIVGNGQRVRFWLDSWVERCPLVELCRGVVPEDIRRLTVADVWCRDTGWRWELIVPFLPEDVLLRIMAFYFDPLSEDSDTLAWGESVGGEFSVASAYNLIREPSELPRRRWGLIWKLRVPERIRIFFWKSWHERLMVNQYRARIGLSGSSECSICHDGEESILHVLRDCRHVREFWSIFVPSSLQHLFFACSLDEWFCANLAYSRRVYDRIPWNVLFATVCWYAWKNRNERIFRSREGLLYDERFICARAVAFMEARERLCLFAGKPARRDELVGWSRPSVGWRKVNTDGASRGNPGPASCGVALRDHNGEWMTGACRNLGICSSMMAELWGVYIGLEFAWASGHRKWILETDSRMALELLKTPPREGSHLRQLVMRCRSLIQRDWTIITAHVYREANRLADWLANHALSLEVGLYSFCIPPSGGRDILRDDVVGVSFSRSVVCLGVVNE